MESCYCSRVLCVVLVFKFQLNVLSFVDDIVYKHIVSVYLVCDESFCQRNCIFLTLRFVYITMIFLFLCLACNLISNIQILANYSERKSKPF